MYVQIVSYCVYVFLYLYVYIAKTFEYFLAFYRYFDHSFVMDEIICSGNSN